MYIYCDEFHNKNKRSVKSIAEQASEIVLTI